MHSTSERGNWNGKPFETGLILAAVFTITLNIVGPVKILTEVCTNCPKPFCDPTGGFHV